MAGAQGSKGHQHKKTLSGGEVPREGGVYPDYSKGLASHSHASTTANVDGKRNINSSVQRPNYLTHHSNEPTASKFSTAHEPREIPPAQETSPLRPFPFRAKLVLPADQRIESRNNPNANPYADRHQHRNPRSKHLERERNLVQHVASSIAAQQRLLDDEDRLEKQSRSADSAVEPSEPNPRIRASRKFSSKNPLYLALPLPGVDHEKDKYPSRLRGPFSSGRLRSAGVPVMGRLVQKSPRHHHRDGRHYHHHRRHHGHCEGHRRGEPPSRPSVCVPGKWTPTQEHLVDAGVDYKEISLHSVFGSWKPPRALLL